MGRGEATGAAGWECLGLHLQQREHARNSRRPAALAAQVQDAVRAEKAVAVGFMDRWGNLNMGSIGDGSIVTLQEGEKLVVLADN